MVSNGATPAAVRADQSKTMADQDPPAARAGDPSDPYLGETPAESLAGAPLLDMTESMDLVVQAQAGDEGALNDLLQRYEPRLRRVVRIRLGARLRNHMESGDIVQDAYQVAFQKIGDLELRSAASILQWLSTIAEHKIKDANDYFSAQKRDTRREVPLETKSARDGSTSFELDLASDDAAPEERAFRGEIRDMLDEAMVELSEEHREVILARDYFGGSWEYVAEQLERAGNVHATQELHRRAWKRLKELVRPRLGGAMDAD